MLAALISSRLTIGPSSRSEKGGFVAGRLQVPVPDATGSSEIPVSRNASSVRDSVRTRLCGVLRNGDLLAVVMFSKVPIPGLPPALRNMAIEVKTLLFNFEDANV